MPLLNFNQLEVSMKKVFLILMSIFITSTAFAKMFSFSNFYLDGFGGVNFVNSLEENDVRTDLNAGYIAGGALGYRFSRFFRIEGEGAYRSNSFNRLVINGQKFSATGHIHKTTAMANGIVELPLWSCGWSPYFGAGIGERWDRESFSLKPITSPEGITTDFPKFEKKGQGLAYQGILGVIFCSYKKMQLGVEYRYLDGSDIQANNSLDVNLKRYF